MGVVCSIRKVVAHIILHWLVAQRVIMSLRKRAVWINVVSFRAIQAVHILKVNHANKMEILIQLDALPEHRIPKMP